MMRARSKLSLVALVAGATAAVAPQRASAQSSTSLTISYPTTSTLVRFDANGNSLTRTYPSPNQNGLAGPDCDEDTSIQFVVNLAGTIQSNPISVYASTGGACDSDSTARSGASATCWQVHAQIAEQNVITVTLKVRDLFSQFAATVKAPDTFIPGTKASCDSAKASLASGSTNLNIYFVVLSGSTAISSGPPYTIPVKLQGPAAPTGLSATTSESKINVTFTAATDPDTRTYVAYCYPVPKNESSYKGVEHVDAGQVDPSNHVPACVSSPWPDAPAPADAGADGSATADAGVTTDAGDDGGDAGDAGTDASGGASPGTVSTTPLETSASPAVIPDKYKCGGGATSFASSIQVTGVSVGYAYNVAVAATDSFGNVGPPSDWICARPIFTDSFWDVYKRSNGAAEGGVCALQGVGLPAGIGGLLLVAGVGIGASARRRRRRS